MSTEHGAEPRAVLLTGATGGLGGYLCAELLAQTSATIHCLVRGSDSTVSTNRLRQRLGRLDPALDIGPRLNAFSGDLQQPDLGLRPRAADALAETVDTIVHCAASVNLAAPYEQLTPTNLDSTLHLAALAQRRIQLTGHAPTYCFVSTLATLIGARSIGLHEVDENTVPSMATAGNVGYSRSKVAAETALQDLPAKIMRPGVVTGNSHTARTTNTDVLASLLRAAITLGAAPITSATAPTDMVDIVAHGIVALLRRPDTPGRAFHLARPEPLRLADLFDALRRFGHRLAPLSMDDWWRRIDEHVVHPAVLPVAAAEEAYRYLLATDTHHHMPRIRSDTTWTRLTEASVPRPPLDAAFLYRFVAELTETGGLPPPRPAPSATVPAQPSSAPAHSENSQNTRSITIDGAFDPTSFRDCFTGSSEAAAACQAAGYHGLWLRERQHDPIPALAAAAAATTRIDICSGVLIGLARNPMTLASSANDLNALSQGRLILGLGSQTTAHLRHRFSMPPDQILARTREFIAALRAIWRSWNDDKPLHFTGRFYRHTLMTPYFTPPPNPHGAPRTFLAAVGPKMAELAGQVADGLIVHSFSSQRYLAEILLPAVARGLARSGRPRESFAVVCNPLVATGTTDQERARNTQLVRQQIAFFGSTTTYQRVLQHHGLGELAEQLTELTMSADPNRWQRMGELIPNDVLDLFAITAPAHQVGEELRSRFDGLADRVALPVPYGPEATAWTTVAKGLGYAQDPNRLR